MGAEEVLQTLAGFEKCAAAGTVLVLELVGTSVFALTLETLIGRRASGLFTEHAKTPTSPRNYPGSCSQREPKSPKGHSAPSVDFRGFLCGSLAPVSI
jgi:hypothetical protein